MSLSLTGAAFHPPNSLFVLGLSPAIQRLNSVVEDVARTSIPVLLVGESGTGKEVYGRAIHRLSKQGQWPLKKVNCRAVDQGELLALLKSDLRKSAESPEDGVQTLFLDGIDELDLGSQRALLSLLADGEIEENGSKGMRIIASTSRNLEKEIESGRFRRELYFRINGVCLRLPPLRDRKEDILVFMEHFLAKHASELGREVPVLSDQEMELLMTHDWPGNLREMENLARKIIVLGDTRRAIEELRAMPRLDPALTEEPRGSSLKVAARAASRRTERDLIAKALERTHWNRKRAAHELQISYKSLLYKIKQTGLIEEQKERE
jgi:two-component system, NtrC family, response regulator AtoC